MREKDSQVVSLFTLLGSTSVKAERKYVGEIDTRIKYLSKTTFSTVTNVKKLSNISFFLL